MAADERFATIANRTVHIDALYEIVADSLTVRTTAEWLEALAEADIAAMPMHDVESVIDDPHIQAIGLFSEHEHPTEGKVRYIEAPVRLSKTPGGLRHHADLLGQSSVPILAEIGLDEAEIGALIAAGVTIDGRP